MSEIIQHIRQPIEAHLLQFEKKFEQAVYSDVYLLNKITKYVIKRKGKQIRPLLVFLSAKMFGEVNDATHHAAALIELLHTATLLHDDVVDNSQERRGFFSVYALWKSKATVLVGDFLLAKGLLLSVQNKSYHILEIVSEAVKEMSEGELLQLDKSRKLDITEEVYFDIITKKTASLIAACCATGSASVLKEEESILKMKQLGYLIGIAFQIKDDLLDYTYSETTGKPSGIDIQEQKMTLPVIYALQQASSSDKKRMINIFKNYNEDADQIKWMINKVIELGGIQYTQNKMKEYHRQAKEMLYTFPENEARKSMELLIDYTIERVK
ncbi:MAG: polyprenyl synthetase family protein [Bacteroidia bacterium]|nr:polyprenyl synthetase family protein [Bacteroidia bacterium]